MQNGSAKHEIPGGTKVLNTEDGEPGTVLNGYGRTADAALAKGR